MIKVSHVHNGTEWLLNEKDECIGHRSVNTQTIHDYGGVHTSFPFADTAKYMDALKVLKDAVAAKGLDFNPDFAVVKMSLQYTPKDK